MAKYVRKLGQELLFYKRGMRITLIDIFNGNVVLSFRNDDGYISIDVILTKLEPYLDYYIVGEVTGPEDEVFIYISNIIP